MPPEAIAASVVVEHRACARGRLAAGARAEHQLEHRGLGELRCVADAAVLGRRSSCAKRVERRVEQLDAVALGGPPAPGGGAEALGDRVGELSAWPNELAARFGPRVGDRLEQLA